MNCGVFSILDHLSPDFSGRIRIATCSWLAAWRSKSNLLRRPFKSSGKVRSSDWLPDSALRGLGENSARMIVDVTDLALLASGAALARIWHLLIFSLSRIMTPVVLWSVFRWRLNVRIGSRWVSPVFSRSEEKEGCEHLPEQGVQSLPQHLHDQTGSSSPWCWWRQRSAGLLKSEMHRSAAFWFSFCGIYTHVLGCFLTLLGRIKARWPWVSSAWWTWQGASVLVALGRKALADGKQVGYKSLLFSFTSWKLKCDLCYFASHRQH